MDGKPNMNEDVSIVFPHKNGDFPLVMLVFRGVKYGGRR